MLIFCYRLSIQRAFAEDIRAGTWWVQRPRYL